MIPHHVPACTPETYNAGSWLILIPSGSGKKNSLCDCTAFYMVRDTHGTPASTAHGIVTLVTTLSTVLIGVTTYTPSKPNLKVTGSMVVQQWGHSVFGCMVTPRLAAALIMAPTAVTTTWLTCVGHLG